jgi:hypothetical protein
MSSSYPDRTLSPLVALAVGSALAAVGAGSAGAAQTYYQPMVEVRVEQNTNRNLSPDAETEDDIHGYIGIAELLWGRLTETSDTRIRPRLRFQHYPDRRDIERLEQFLDFSTRNQSTERSAWRLDARYSRRDAFNAELGDASFDELDPDQFDDLVDIDRDDPAGGTEPGEILNEETRTRYQVSPSFNHRFTETTGINLNADYRAVRFSAESGPNRREYDQAEVGAALTHRLNPRSVISIGPYAARFETRDDLNTTDSIGLTLGWDRVWSELWETRLQLTGEHSEVELGGPVPTTDRDTYLGGEFAGIYRTLTGRFRFSLGRFFLPTTSGARSIVDELRAQYEWDATQRLSFVTALRAYQREAQGDLATGSSDRDYARGEFGARWMVTPLVFIGGGYQYTWQERATDAGSADNHAVYLSFGYRGLGPQR